jgi:hypothetical protein
VVGCGLPTTPDTDPLGMAATTAAGRPARAAGGPRSVTRKRASRDARSQRSQTVPVIVWPAASRTTWRVAAQRQLATLQQPITRMPAGAVVVMVSILA